MNTRAEDASPVKISREIPLPWLITMAVGILVNGVIMWQSQKSQEKLIGDLSGEVKELRGSIAGGSLKIVEHEMKLADLERRITVQETKK